VVVVLEPVLLQPAEQAALVAYGPPQTFWLSEPQLAPCEQLLGPWAHGTLTGEQHHQGCVVVVLLVVLDVVVVVGAAVVVVVLVVVVQLFAHCKSVG
jgi:hypothetical protein